MFWSLVKPMIPGRTLHRIHFFGSDYQKELQKFVAPENLPVGGLPELSLVHRCQLMADCV